MLSQFRTYQLALSFHRAVVALSVPSYLRDQLLRSSSSVVLNIAEGSGKPSPADQRRFYGIALGSLRESCAALEMRGETPSDLAAISDQLGACLYRLVHPK